MAIELRRCPGYWPTGQEPHDLPADLVSFNANRSGKDGLSVRCRSCGNAYLKDWAAAKKRGEKFSLRRADAAAEAAATDADSIEPMAASLPHGWAYEKVDGINYSLPTDPAVIATEQGQEALDAINEARATYRRKRDAERKRAERAAVKAAQASAPAR
jgi:hypothetical protein